MVPEFNNEDSRFQITGEKPVLTSSAPDLPEKKSKKPFVMGGLGLLIAGGMVVGTLTLVGKLGADEVKPSDTAAPVTAAVEPAGNEWYFSKDIPLVVDVPEWGTEQLSATPQLTEDEDFLEEAYEEWEGTKTLGKAQTTYRSTATGLVTDDMNEAFDSIGLPNPNYTFVSEEVFVGHLAIIHEKFLNPVAGGWTQYQYRDSGASETFDERLLSDVVTPEYANRIKNSANKSFVPIMADWNRNDFGMDNLVPEGPRWFGEIEDSDVVLDWNKDRNNYDVYVTSQVRYVSWTVDKKKVEKTGVLKLKLVANPSAVQNLRLLRLLVADGSLELN